MVAYDVVISSALHRDEEHVGDLDGAACWRLLPELPLVLCHDEEHRRNKHEQ